MDVRKTALVCALCLPLCTLAQEPSASQTPTEKPEEILVIGQRQIMQLRLQMLDAEKLAYDVFNQFNDEKRFEISCSTYQPIGTRLKAQSCQPEFEIAAMGEHGRTSLESFRTLYNAWANVGPGTPLPPVYDTPPPMVPMAAQIAKQRPEYQKKLRQVAEEHPEFLEALIRYSETRARYEEATSSRQADD